MEFTIDSQGLLQGDKVSHKLTDKHSGRFGADLPDTILMHYTGGSTLDGAVSHLANPRVQASAHLVIGRDGRVVQMVPFNCKAWHAGRSHHLNRSGMNHYSIGIEIVNAGPLTPSGDQYIASFGKKYPPEEVIKARHRNQSESGYWQTYTEAQLQCVKAISMELIDALNIEFILGHEEVAPARKTDPGPAFPLDSFRDQLLSSRKEHDDSLQGSTNKTARKSLGVETMGMVTASLLNVRKLPSVSADKLREPLKAGQNVEIIQERAGWYEITIKETGWVKKDFIQSDM